MTDTLSLGPVLDLIERLQKCDRGSAYEFNLITVINCLDVAELRQLAEQHAAQLRGLHPLPDEDEAILNAAIDFLAAPRREQEVE